MRLIILICLLLSGVGIIPLLLLAYVEQMENDYNKRRMDYRGE